MARDFHYFWAPSPSANVDHVGDSGVSEQEFEQVFERGFNDRRPSRSRPDRWIVRDFTDAGRKLVVVFEFDDLAETNSWGITPVSAYPPEKPPAKG